MDSELKEMVSRYFTENKDFVIKNLLLISTIVCLHTFLQDNIIILKILVNTSDNTWSLDIFICSLILVSIFFLMMLSLNTLWKIHLCQGINIFQVENKKSIINPINFSINFSIIIYIVSMIIKIYLLFVTYKLKENNFEEFIGFMILNDVFIYLFSCVFNYLYSIVILWYLLGKQ
jgi:hypothetical protein